MRRICERRELVLHLLHVTQYICKFNFKTERTKSVALNICWPRDCVSRHNEDTSGAPLKPLRDDSALRSGFTTDFTNFFITFWNIVGRVREKDFQILDFPPWGSPPGNWKSELWKSFSYPPIPNSSNYILKCEKKIEKKRTIIVCFMNLVKSNQISIINTLFQLIWHQTEFSMVLNQLEKCNYNS